MNHKIQSKYIMIGETNIHYLIAGTGEPILFIHGFPTSSFLWRNIIERLLDNYMIIAIDLPGYGKSDKRISDSYSFRYYDHLLTSLFNQLDIEKITLGVHDLGGPVGLHWMVRNMQRVDGLILFNTLVYPKFSLGVKLFILATMLPGLKNWLTSPSGIEKTMKFGVFNKENLTAETIETYQSPFTDKASRKVLLKSIQRLSMKGFKEIEEKFHSFEGPIQIIYGENDKILPKVSETMKKVKKNLPQANIVAIPNCGHFLQEDSPEQVSEIILEFMKNK